MDGILAALFAVLIIIVIADGMRMCVKALRAGEPLPTTEAPFEKSKLVAPAGLVPTRADREAERELVGAAAGPSRDDAGP